MFPINWEYQLKKYQVMVRGIWCHWRQTALSYVPVTTLQCIHALEKVFSTHMMWKIRMVTYVSESQIIAEEVLFELGQSGSANPHRRSLPWLSSNTLIVTKTAAFSYSTSKHSQENRAESKTWCAGWSSHLAPTSHTLQRQTHHENASAV